MNWWVFLGYLSGGVAVLCFCAWLRQKYWHHRAVVEIGRMIESGELDVDLGDESEWTEVLPPLTRWERRIYSLLEADPTREWNGLELCHALVLRLGSLSAALAGLERKGLVSHRFEPGPTPRRVLYRLKEPQTSP